MTQRPPARRPRADEGGVGGGTAPPAIGIEWVLAMVMGLVLIIVALIVANIVEHA